MSQVESASPVLVTYGVANEAMFSTLESKKLKKYARVGWNGKNLHVQVHGSIPTNQVDLGNGDNAYLNPFLVIVNKDRGSVDTWVPSISDLQGKDWYEVI